MTTYHVTAERGAGVWVLQCDEYPGALSESRRLSAAPRLMREAIAFVADVDEDDVEVEVTPVLPEGLRDEVAAAREAVREVSRQQQEAARLSREAARHLVEEERLSGADAAAVLGVSPQRVSQLVHR